MGGGRDVESDREWGTRKTVGRRNEAVERGDREGGLTRIKMRTTQNNNINIIIHEQYHHQAFVAWLADSIVCDAQLFFSQNANYGFAFAFARSRSLALFLFLFAKVSAVACIHNKYIHMDMYMYIYPFQQQICSVSFSMLIHDIHFSCGKRHWFHFIRTISCIKLRLWHSANGRGQKGRKNAHHFDGEKKKEKIIHSHSAVKQNLNK